MAFRVPGPCTIKFGDTPLSLGVSKSGVIIRSRTTWAPVTDDAHGSEPVDFIYTGRAVQVEVAGLDVATLKTATIWPAYGGLLGSHATNLTAIGALASALAQVLSIIERGAVYTWTALKAVPLDPDSLMLASTTELQVPVTFLIVPDGNGKLFSTLPTYIV